MTPTPTTSPFRLPRLSRAATRHRETNPAWSLHLATVTFIGMIVLTFLGPVMTIDNRGPQNLLREVGYIASLVLAVIATRPWRHPERLLVVPWPLLLALAWCWLSLLWALDAGVGMRRLALTTIIIWSLFALVRQMGVERSVSVLRLMLALLLAANFLIVLEYPSLGIHTDADGGVSGTWRGLMSHKNVAGIPCALAIIFVAFDASAVRLAVRIAIAVGAALFLVMTDSETSRIMCGVAFVGGVIFHLLSARVGPRRLAPPRSAWVMLGVAAAIVISMAFNNAPFLEMLSDPGGFTGRTQVWTALIKAYADRPWLGIGFGSFWDLGPEGPIFTYGSGWITEVSEGHNGYLDMLVQVGAIGTLLILFAVIVWPTQRLLHGGTHPVRTLAAAVLLFGVGHNFTESMLFDRDGLVQVFMMIAIAWLWEVTAAPVSGPSNPAPAPRPTPERPRTPLRL